MEGDGILSVSEIVSVNSMAFDQQKYIQEFNKENYDRVEFNIPKGRKKELKQFAKSKGRSVSEVIVEALESYYDINLSKYGDFDP